MMLFIAMLALLVIGVPIAASMGISSLLYVLFNGMNPIVIVQRVFSGIDQSAYLAIPYFVLAGEIMNQGGIAKRIVALVQGLVGNISGGLGIVAILSVMFFGAISGSAIASAVAIGGVMYAGLLRSGYGRGFSAALIASAAPMDNIIPPSIGLVIYGVLSRTSIGDLYKLGFPTGMIITTNLSVGMMTPPFGITLFASMRVFKASMAEVVKNMLPFLIALIVALLLITYVPGLIMWIV